MKKAVAKTRPELLAPAGSLEAGITAFDCGADAVYTGLDRFNARERGRNLTLAEFGKLTEYARRGNRKVYLAINTLIKESELPAVAEMLRDVVPFAPAAIIVQDLGVVRLLRNYFPELAIHASTQMGIHNSAGVELAAERGIERVILQRQLTFEEIRKIQQRAPIELEVFVHGALCCCRSGNCLLSSWLGGWSGNRGKCKQPCRRRYRSPGGNGFFLSTNDLCLLDHVHELADMGIASLKIEGRLRGPDYVASVVTAYRMMLDTPPEEHKSSLKKARAILADSLGRRWTPGFRRKEDFADVINHSSLGSSGLLCGRVNRNRSDGFEITPARPLRLGDRIRIQPPSGEEGPSFEITRITRHHKSVKTAAPGTVHLIHCERPVPENGYVFKIANQRQSSEVRLARLPAPLPAPPLSIRVYPDAVEVRLPVVEDLLWRKQADNPPAQKHALDQETVRAEFSKAGGTKFAPGLIQAQVTPGLFVAGAVLKQWRKEFWAWLDENLTPEILCAGLDLRIEALQQELAQPLPQPRENAKNMVILPPGKQNPLSKTQTARELGDKPTANDVVILPEFVPETEQGNIRRRLRELVDQGYRHFCASSLHAFRLMPQRGDFQLSTTFPLPAANSLAFAELVELGAQSITLWPEMEEQAAGQLFKRVGTLARQLIFARPPLISTRAKLPVEGEISDGRGLFFHTRRSADEQTHLYSQKAFKISPLPKIPTLIDLRNAELNEDNFHDFNNSHEWI